MIVTRIKITVDVTRELQLRFHSTYEVSMRTFVVLDTRVKTGLGRRVVRASL